MDINKKWSSYKYKKRAGLRYEIGLVIRTGLLAWVNGPFPCVMFTDTKIFVEGGIIDELTEHERVEADGAYTCFDPMYCKTPYGHTIKLSSRERIEMSYRVRARHETVNQRYRIFNILKHVYRHKIGDHGDVINAVSVLVQLSLKHGNPLFPIDDYE